MKDDIPIYCSIEPPKDLNLHINHPTLGCFTIHRRDNALLGLHELEELFRYIKEHVFGVDE